MSMTDVAPLPVAGDALACCPDGIRAPLSRETAESLSRLLKAVADPTRLQLLSLIKAPRAGRRASATSRSRSG